MKTENMQERGGHLAAENLTPIEWQEKACVEETETGRQELFIP